MLGAESIPIGIFIALFTGIVLALLASYSAGDLVPPYFVGTLVQKTITLELAPVLTGLALAGRVGANIAAELGTMRWKRSPSIQGVISWYRGCWLRR